MDIIKYYGSDETKTEFINHDSEPLMAVIAHDRKTAKIFNISKSTVHTVVSIRVGYVG